MGVNSHLIYPGPYFLAQHGRGGEARLDVGTIDQAKRERHILVFRDLGIVSAGSGTAGCWRSWLAPSLALS